MKLSIKKSSWSGWSKDYKPEVKEEVYDIKLNEKYIIDSTNTSYVKDGKFTQAELERFSFEIVEVNDDNIRIKTFQPFSDNPGGAINLKSDKKEFVVTFDNELKLKTPSTDCGYIYRLILVQ